MFKVYMISKDKEITERIFFKVLNAKVPLLSKKKKEICTFSYALSAIYC